jgi:hypothetical protein
MIALAERLGWLTPVERRAELVRMIEDRLASDDAGVADVDLICTLNRDHALDDVLGEIAIGASRVKSAGRAGILACLGSPVAHARILEALLSPKDEDVQIAQVYLRHRPLADVTELRLVAAGIARMSNSEAQVRALDALARHQLSDRESLETLTHLFPVAKTLDVQRAIAGILIRADYGALARPELVRALRQHRLKSSGGNDLIDVLIRRLQASLPPAA